MTSFRSLGLSDKIIRVLKERGFTRPTTIQERVIPLLMEGRKDIVARSQTGTGKTAAFALPIIEKTEEYGENIQAIILTPTRELALQVSKEFESLKGDKKIKILPVYGGTSIGIQLRKLEKHIDIIVGTPGRIIDLQKRKAMDISRIKYAVLDEADEMLNMGFIEDIRKILQGTPEERTTLMFSATIPEEIMHIAQRYMKKYELIKTEKLRITDDVKQVYYEIEPKDRIEGLKRVLDYYPDFHGIIFCNTKIAVNALTSKLIGLNYKAEAIHGDFDQERREKILNQFRGGHIKILVATDVAARGIDVRDLTHVINFSLPQSPDSYVHRIGRTGRAGKKGISITFMMPSEKRKLRTIEQVNKCRMQKEKIPSPYEIAEKKESHIKTLIESIIEKGDDPTFEKIANDLLKDNKAQKIISAALKYSFRKEFNLKKYRNFSEIDSEEADFDAEKPAERKEGTFRKRPGPRRKKGQRRKTKSRYNKERSR